MNIEEIKNQLNEHQAELYESGTTFQQVLRQLELIDRGKVYADIIKPCKIDDGILRIKRERHDELINIYKSAAASGRLMKFVPASGAATRMFSKLQNYLNHCDSFSLSKLKEDADSNINAKAVYDFLKNINQFAFYDDLKIILKKENIDPENLNDDTDVSIIIRRLLDEKGLNYAFYPKGALSFHKYSDRSGTAFEEHLYEAVELLSDSFGAVKIHFTISEEHTDLFLKIVKNTTVEFEKRGIKLKTTFSFQKKSTNTISVTPDNELFRNSNDKLVFRPAGHGALLENLNDLNSDIILIKNIDNVLPSTKNKKVIIYEKIMTGYLISIQKEIFSYLRLLEQMKISENLILEIKRFAVDYLSIYFPENFDRQIDKIKIFYLLSKLNRPLRVCGMVKNEGQPGGGPFWVRNSDGEISIQIIEESQIDKDNPAHSKALIHSTHFNPVDMVCAVKDYKGNKFNLKDYVDENSGLIIIKSYEGKPLKALELPGLWNGGMAFWNTVFVEMPLETFIPVKEINDLLNPSHKAEVK